MRGLASRVLPSLAETPGGPDAGPPAGAGLGDAAFDSEFYRRLLADMLNGDVTVDEAVELG